MTNDETRPLPAVPPVPPAPPSPWATTQPLVPAPPSPYGPEVSAQPRSTSPESAHPRSRQAPPPQPAPGWADAEPDPWVDITPGRVDAAPASGAPGPRPAGQGRRVLGVIGLVAAGAAAGALIVNAIGGLGGSNTAAVQPAGAGQNGTVPNGVAPGGGVQGGAPGAQGGVPGQGLRGGLGGQDGEQRLTGTLTGVSASRLTVRTSSGPATYQVVSQTEIVRNGAVASASDLKVGDRVLVHVFPANGSDGVLERVIAVTGPAPGSGTAGTQDSGDAETSDT